MAAPPRLSICVPSRNRQSCFGRTIGDLVASPRPDIEFVFADNSDDPTVINRLVAELGDVRIRYLPSEDRPLSMIDNWERTVRAATGDWVTVIGDDDYVDPDLVDFIDRIEGRDQGIDAIAWNRAAYQWPDARSFPKAVTISLANRIMRHPHEAIMERLFGWLGASYMPLCPYGIYHGAVPRRSLDRIRGQFSGRFFEHPTVDYDFSHKLLVASSSLVFIDRPISVLGAAAVSNSAAVGSEKEAARAVAAYKQEYGSAFDQSAIETGFPFTSATGVAGNIMAAQHFFKTKYGFAYGGWEEGFSRAVTNECRIWKDRTEFDRFVGLCRAAFSRWDDGRHAHLFQPQFNDADRSRCYFGVDPANNLRISQDIDGIETPAEFYRIIRQILPEPADVALEM
jgi:glycosyltransferase involved in cell wall biosynthesis